MKILKSENYPLWGISVVGMRHVCDSRGSDPDQDLRVNSREGIFVNGMSSASLQCPVSITFVVIYICNTIIFTLRHQRENVRNSYRPSCHCRRRYGVRTLIDQSRKTGEKQSFDKKILLLKLSDKLLQIAQSTVKTAMKST